MSKPERLALVQSIATRPARVLTRCEGFTLAQAKRVLRRLCPKLNAAH